MPSLTTTTALVLAGGLGTRLRSVVGDRPKVLAEVRGRPFLAHLLDRLVAPGIRDIVLSTGYLADQVEATFGDHYRGASVRYSRETAPLGTGGAVRLALQRPTSRTVLILNGDSYCTVDLQAFANWHTGRASSASVALAQVPDTRRYGRVQLAEHGGAILRFDEKGAALGPGWINAGVYLIDRARLPGVTPAAAVSLERDVFPAWIGHGLYGYTSDAALLDIGTPAAYAQATAFLDGLRQPPLQRAA